MRSLHYALSRGVNHVRRFALKTVGARNRTATTPQGKLAFIEVKGTGPLPPVLLIHGLSAMSADWDRVIRRLRRHCQSVRAIDLPGHGWSDAPRDGMGLRPFLEMLTEAAETFLDVPHHIVGSSLGGLMSVRLAGRFPESATSLSLISPAGTMATQAQLDRVLALFEVDEWQQALGFVDACMGEDPPMRTLMALAIQSRIANPNIQAILQEFSPDWLLAPEKLSALPMPVLLYWGLQDGILGASNLDSYRTHLPPSTEVYTPAREGHAPWMDGPFMDGSEPFVSRLVDFWTGLSTEPHP
jgi:pimeloyl-ACP methyl ester carboxylesterase